MKTYKLLLIFLGTISLAAGFVGIFVPILPTTPFLLLTAALYIKGSDRLYNKLINSRIFGSYIKGFREKNGMSKKQKIYSIIIMWTMIIISFLMLQHLLLRIFLVILGITGSIVMGYIIKTAKK
jgi:uncharacterized membrane protein YbaN (DUF454 family)